MSDTPQGDGWWQTSDGLWHPPDYDPTVISDESAPSDESTSTALPGVPTNAPPGAVPPPWSPTGGSTSTPHPDGEQSPASPQWGDEIQAPAYPPPAGPENTPGGSPEDPLFGESVAAGTQTGVEPAPGTLRPGEFGLTSDLPPPTEPRVVRQAPQKTAAAAPTGSPVDKPGMSPVIKWSGLVVAVLVVLFAGWYFLLRDSGSGENAATAEASAVAGETTVSDPGATTGTEATTSMLPPKPTIAPGARLPVLEFSGTADSTVTIDPPGPRVAKITYSGSGPFKVTGLDANGGQVAPYVDTTGSYKGAVAVDFHDEQDSRSLEITANGPWEIRMVPVESLTAQEGAFSGAGDNVVLYAGDVGPVTITHSGSGRFTVNTFEIKTREIDTIVDETGPYDGTVEMRGPAFVWITADGNWSVTPG